MPEEHQGLRLLRSVAIYGSNAAGKTNILRALATLRQLVETTATSVQKGRRLQVAPFALSKSSVEMPSEFEIVFIADDGVRYNYFCAVTSERVHKEWLVAYPTPRGQRWFEREYDAKEGNYTWWFGPNFKGERAEQKVWRDFTRSNALFLSTAIQLNNDQLKPAFFWPTRKLLVLKTGDGLDPILAMALLRREHGPEQVMRYMRAADVGIDRLELVEEFGRRVRVLAWHKQADSDEMVALDMCDESEGIRRLFEFAGGWIHALAEGATLLADELDRSLHPYVTRFLVGLFHGSTNTSNAQLVFTTHDKMLLNSDLMRRDQIWFVEKGQDKSSRIYGTVTARAQDKNLTEWSAAKQRSRFWRGLG